MRNLVIGDIHGASKALAAILKEVEPFPDDRIVFLGDYIDRGDDSRAVLDRLLQLQASCRTVFLRGNHEVMMLSARLDTTEALSWQSCGGFETLISYGAEYRDEWVSAIPERHWAFLEATVPCFETERHIFVYACAKPEVEMSEQPDWMLYWTHFDYIQPHQSGRRIICGHSVQRSGRIKDLGFAVCIDTGPAVGGWLTCLEADTGEYWQANEKGETRTALLPLR